MQIHVQVGDVLAVAADALISTANPWLNLSGGVNGAILAATGPATQEELHAYLKSQGISAVPAGTVIQSSSGNLPFDCILHAVAIDPFYDSTAETDLLTLSTTTSLDVYNTRRLPVRSPTAPT
ncbi:macro domain-containing protein [Rhodopirellula baltica]|uniref:Protein containing Appr-1-p processing domain n=1 Tax=Rhodopirellula baltica WH47 TaxID=991778 RepID=F2AQQ2_RHOBT|nr:macro domain-containing protein [Rhodopirellula baltica]EGF28006.1 protein containing Appr-1-p processing domain [Rhodopirellula baltica WH47]